MLLFGPELNADRRYIGSIDVKCNVAEVVQDAYDNARFLCEQYYMCSPALNMEVISKEDGEGRLEMVYVPSHLYHILFEILKNSMRAVVELDEDSVDSRPVTVRLCKGSEDVVIQVSGDKRREEGKSDAVCFRAFCLAAFSGNDRWKVTWTQLCLNKTRERKKASGQ